MEPPDVPETTALIAGWLGWPALPWGHTSTAPALAQAAFRMVGQNSISPSEFRAATKGVPDGDRCPVCVPSCFVVALNLSGPSPYHRKTFIRD